MMAGWWRVRGARQGDRAVLSLVYDEPLERLFLVFRKCV
jgi:hypothetical protein